MLAEITTYEDKLSLIMNSGIQFLDFAVKPDLRQELPGEFIRRSNGTLMRLIFDERVGDHTLPGMPGKVVESEFSVALNQSLKLLNDIWLPAPFLRFNPPRVFDQGPGNWARVRIHALHDDEKDADGNTHRITFAFDTRVVEGRRDTSYLAPIQDDVHSGSSFALAFESHELDWFMDLAWIDDWLREVFTEQARNQLRLHPDDIDEDLRNHYHQAHYLNLLELLGRQLHIPELRINGSDNAIPVDLLLDVGNSRTCGILVEQQANERDGLSKRYELELRDLSEPHRLYAEPFESRIEFSQTEFGKKNFSVQSGRTDAFQWPTINRVGVEAGRLAASRRGTEGSTGLSSPKRYLWDEERYQPGWRFNSAFVKSEKEPLATAAPLTNLINDRGEALYTLDEHSDERMPVFTPNYSRSSLMTFMLTEVLAQALMQINSPAQRMRLSHSREPRYLRSITLTVPPSMTKPERVIFTDRLNQSIGLVWKAMGWYDIDLDLKTPENRRTALIPLPDTHVEWDEATCGQLVYLYNETQNHFSGRPEEFFATTARADKQLRDGSIPGRTLDIATIDIGGGTTDLVINHYRLDEGIGSNVNIIPEQRFRDGFKIAGDDILLDVVQLFIIPTLREAVKRTGLTSPDALLSRLIGSEAITAHEAVLRQQFTLQILSPLGLALLKAYEHYDPLDPAAALTGTLGDLLPHRPTDAVLDFINGSVRRALGAQNCTFDILETPVNVRLRRMHEEFLGGRMNICQTIRALSEVAYLYTCDVLLLTGRPSRLPGIQAYFRQLLALPESRILPMHGYHTSGWYPFNRQGQIDDPKTTAAVGAMLCLLAQKLRLPNFYFQSKALRPYSTLKYLGLIDNNGVIKDSNLYYRDIDLDNDDYQLPDINFEMRGPMRLGFRQLGSERWSASPLYTLTFNPNNQTAERVQRQVADGGVLKVSLKLDERQGKKGTERFSVARVELDSPLSDKVLKLTLNTLADYGLTETQYWLDSGSVLRK